MLSVKKCAKGLVAELTPPHAQSAWGSRGENVRAMQLAVCCNYFSKKKKSVKKCEDATLAFTNGAYDGDVFDTYTIFGMEKRNI